MTYASQTSLSAHGLLDTDGFGPQLAVRSYQRHDYEQVWRLSRVGYGPDGPAGPEPVDDLHDIERINLADVQNHLWVATVGTRVVGMIAVRRQEQPHVAELRCLRVEPQWHNSCVPARLIHTALEHCQKQGFLKVIFETHYQIDAMVRFLTRHGFQYARSKHAISGKTLEFYLNLYRKPELMDEKAAAGGQ